MRTLILAAALATAIAPAVAQPSKRGKAELRRYCSGDATTFCADADPGSPEMTACFKKNMGKLSKNCRRAIQAYKEK